MDQEQD